jgi:hypothetical protein
VNTFDYEFIYNDIIDGFSSVQLKKHGHQSCSFFIAIDDIQFRLLLEGQLSSLLADLLDLAVAIHFVDKLALPRKQRPIQIKVCLPLRHPEIFKRFSQELTELLFHYTADFWSFQFSLRQAKARKAESSSDRLLNFNFESSPAEVALWSGGLDSLAGVQKRLVRHPQKQFLLIGTGSNNIIHKTQKQVFRDLFMLPHATRRLRFLNIPIKADYGQRFSQNKSHRARGIVFLFIGAVGAFMEKCNKLHVYENGVGAINLHFSGSVGRDHSKAVHPVSLFRLSKFISAILGNEFEIKNPFLFSTKAEMCNSLRDHSQLASETISCDRLHREKPIQCGYCSSCILRRHALAVADVEDTTSYLVPDKRKPEGRHLIYWRLMNQQVKQIDSALQAKDPWSILGQAYPNNLPQIVNCIDQQEADWKEDQQQNIINLYRTYVREWWSVANQLGNSIFFSEKDYLEDEKWQQMSLKKLIHVK